MQVNAKELRLHLSEYLDRASRGQVLDISMRGKPVARLSRIDSRSPPKRDDLFGIWSDFGLDTDAATEVRKMRQGRQF